MRARHDQIEAAVLAVIKQLSGRELTASDTTATFFDLGFDSLLLTQASQQLRQKFGVKLTFRQLMETLVTIEAVTTYLEEHVPAEKLSAAPAPTPVATPAAAPAPLLTAQLIGPTADSSGKLTPSLHSELVDRVVKQQLVLMNQQLDLLRASGMRGPENGSTQNGHHPSAVSPTRNGGPVVEKIASQDPAPRFGPYKPLERGKAGGLTDRQQAHLDKLIVDYTSRTARSKKYTQRHRAHFADPRSVAGFRQTWKELVYPLVVKRSSGSRFWDLDNNEYVDVTMGFGTNLFGHSPGFLTRAIANQLKHGVEVGPQSAVAGKVAALMCELTGMERAAFCSTGSEAVLAAVRLARTVTGRTKIATFSGYHGINDEVLVRAAVVDGQRRPAPVAPGIPQHIVNEVLVLDYGKPESLELLRAHAHELAAVLVEPVQSRRPELQPVEFLREVRKITAESETALIFDEIITGFRAHLGGTQALFGIQADMATYGKIIGGGMPIGALCGRARFMDALDGGPWQYGDDSGPEVGMTFFAGTYVRHPLAVRAALSVLTRLKREGPALQEALSAKADHLAGELNSYFEAEKLPLRMTQFRSMMYFVFQPEFKHASLLFFHLRLKGLHIWEGRPVFISTAHTDDELEFVVRMFKECIAELRAGDFLPEAAPAAKAQQAVAAPAAQPATAITSAAGPMEFSLYFFGNYDAAYRDDKYALLQEATKFGDAHGFKAVWLPERHFHSVGGFSPNSSLLACALSAVTTRIQLRGGSVVLPLHHPVRVAEEWSVADNLSQGRTAISIATGWHPNDFVFAPDAYKDRRNICLQSLKTIQRLWRGEAVELPTPGGETLPVRLHPMPKQVELPVWLTCIHKDSYAEAGRSGLNVLGYLMNQTVDELAEKIAAYREGRRSAGLDPATGHVTTLLFTYLDETVEQAQAVARGPLCAYLRSYLDNSQKKIEQQLGDVQVDEEDIDYLTNRSCNDYFEGKSLVGTAESCAVLVARLRALGVDEIGCFVDFGIEPQKVLQSLARATQLLQGETAGALESRTLALPPAEQGLWLLGSMNPEAARAYRESVTLKMTGDLDRPALARSLQVLVDRHGALRTVIEPDGQKQTVQAQRTCEVAWTDLAEHGEGAAEAAKQMLAEWEMAPMSDLAGPFSGAHLLRLNATEHWLVLSFHHVVGNGPSYWVYLEELAELYRSFADGVPAQLPPVFPFEDFVARKVKYETSDESRAAEKFWLEKLTGATTTLDLPFDYDVPGALTYRGEREEIVLSATLAQALKKAGATHRSSLFMVMLSAYGALLHRLSGQDDLVLAAPFDSPIRSEDSDRNLFANTTNMLPLRSRLGAGETFADYLVQMKALVLAASENQDYFFGHLIGRLGLGRQPGRAPLFNVVFNLEAGEFRRKSKKLALDLITSGVPYRGPRRASMFDLYLNAAERENGEILVQCDFNLALIEPATMRRWLAHYESLLAGIAADPATPVAELPLVTATTPSASTVPPVPPLSSAKSFVPVETKRP